MSEMTWTIKCRECRCAACARFYSHEEDRWAPCPYCSHRRESDLVLELETANRRITGLRVALRQAKGK